MRGFARIHGATPLYPSARGGIPLRTPLARVPADPCLPNPIKHTRPRGIHAPGHSFGIIQTMLLALPNFGPERMGRKNSGGYAGMALLSALRAQNQKPKTKNQKPKTKRKNSSGRRPRKNVQVAAVFPGPFGPARR